MTPFPIIRLEIEGMKYQILHALDTHHTEIEDVVKAQLEQALEHFDYTATIRHEVDRILPELVQNAVKTSLQKVMWSRAVTDIIDVQVQTALEALFQGPEV